MIIPTWLLWLDIGTMLVLSWWGHAQWRRAERYKAAAIEYERRVHDLLAQQHYPPRGRR